MWWVGDAEPYLTVIMFFSLFHSFPIFKIISKNEATFLPIFKKNHFCLICLEPPKKCDFSKKTRSEQAQAEGQRRERRIL